MKKKEKIFVVFGAILLVFVFFGKAETIPAKPAISSFENIGLEAKAAYVFDIKGDKPIFALNEKAQLPLASLTKIMTVAVAEELAVNNISSLTDSTLVQSSNEAAGILASLDDNFIEKMNKKAKELNLHQTYFLNETGLDISSSVNGGYGSTSDIARLFVYAFKKTPEAFEATAYGEIDGLKNKNIYASRTTRLIASKTGFTDLAGGNLAVIFDAGFNRPVAAVVLSSSKEGRFSDIQKLIDTTYKYLKN